MSAKKVLKVAHLYTCLGNWYSDQTAGWSPPRGSLVKETYPKIAETIQVKDL